MSFQSKKRLTLAEVLENLDFFTEDDEKGPMKSETIIFVKPPQVITSSIMTCLKKTVVVLMNIVLNLISKILRGSYCVLIDRVQLFR